MPAGSTLQALRRKYEYYKDIALAMQNLCDDLASVCERVASLLSWHDPAASALCCGVCCAVSVLVLLLGFPTVIFLGLLWQVRCDGDVLGAVLSWCLEFICTCAFCTQLFAVGELSLLSF